MRESDYEGMDDERLKEVDKDPLAYLGSYNANPWAERAIHALVKEALRRNTEIARLREEREELLLRSAVPEAIEYQRLRKIEKAARVTVEVFDADQGEERNFWTEWLKLRAALDPED